MVVIAVDCVVNSDKVHCMNTADACLYRVHALCWLVTLYWLTRTAVTCCLADYSLAANVNEVFVVSYFTALTVRAESR